MLPDPALYRSLKKPVDPSKPPRRKRAARFVRVKYDGTVEQSPVIMASLTPIWSGENPKGDEDAGGGGWWWPKPKPR